jgi:hypothetical protein
VSSLTNCPHPYQSALCTQSHRSSVKGHHLLPIHVHPSQHYILEVIALRSRVITYRLFTSISISTIHSKSSVIGQGSSRTHYPRPSQSALCTQVITLWSRVITYSLTTSIPVSTVYSKSPLFGQGSSLTSYPRQSSQHCVLKVTAHRPRAITYSLSTSIRSALCI